MDSELLKAESSEQGKSSPQPQNDPSQKLDENESPGTDVAPTDPPPPQYNPNASNDDQQETATTVVITAQPSPTVNRAVAVKPGDYYLTLSIILTVICCCCGTWDALFCTIPAIFFASAARDSELRGEYNKALSRGKVALILNIVACVWWLITIVIIILAAVLGSNI